MTRLGLHVEAKVNVETGINMAGVYMRITCRDWNLHVFQVKIGVCMHLHVETGVYMFTRSRLGYTCFPGRDWGFPVGLGLHVETEVKMSRQGLTWLGLNILGFAGALHVETRFCMIHKSRLGLTC